MSVLINGMEMPKACVYRENGHLITCALYDSDGYCGALNTEASHKENSKLSVCPIVSVPPHGRLIDADALCKTLRSLAENEYTPGVFANWIENHIDTIIPAEEEHNGE